MSGITHDINDFNNNKWVVRFSNIINMTELDLDTTILDNYVNGFQIPDLNLPILTSIYKHDRQLHPGSIGSRDLNTINLEFKMDEKGKNFYLFHKWLMGTRYGENVRQTIRGEDAIRLNSIDVIELCLLNNNGKLVSKMKFKQCIPTNLSGIQLTYKESEHILFIVTFDFEKLELQPITIEE